MIRPPAPSAGYFMHWPSTRSTRTKSTMRSGTLYLGTSTRIFHGIYMIRSAEINTKNVTRPINCSNWLGLRMRECDYVAASLEVHFQMASQL